MKARSIKIEFDEKDDWWHMSSTEGIELEEAIRMVRAAWKDHEKPKEPLINDEDARDAVYSWASALQIDRVECTKKMTSFGVEVVALEAIGLRSAPKIEFTGYIDADLTDGETYTIAELCREEE